MFGNGKVLVKASSLCLFLVGRKKDHSYVSLVIKKLFLGIILKAFQVHLSEIKFTNYLFYAEIQCIDFS